MRACLSQYVERKLPVIPVLLPGAPQKPALPVFLGGLTWVDLREGITDDGLDRLEWGITGKRPDQGLGLGGQLATPKAGAILRSAITPTAQMETVDFSEPTIGIITALTKEFTAAKAILLDPEECSVPGLGAGRRYFVGRIPSLHGGGHSVVLALAAMGSNIASARATLLLEHFRNVEAVIMVGIAGAVPHPTKPDEHVRLGDIVVSDKRGVIQYDYVKLQNDDPKFEEIRACTVSPSAMLIEAVMFLDNQQLEGKRPWDDHIQRILNQWNWKRPLANTDRLYASDNPNKPIKHPPDPERLPGLPRVFLGPIASANALLKNPAKRDSLRAQFGVKAVEMEGSGIAEATWLHDRGYLVVRGTCDYCDSRKNDAWQKYAAAVAAGYIKALIESLYVISEANRASPNP